MAMKLKEKHKTCPDCDGCCKDPVDFEISFCGQRDCKRCGGHGYVVIGYEIIKETQCEPTAPSVSKETSGS